MSATEPILPPFWVGRATKGRALVVRCVSCIEHPGRDRDNKKMVCDACEGACWIVLETEAPYTDDDDDDDDGDDSPPELPSCPDTPATITGGN